MKKKYCITTISFLTILFLVYSFKKTSDYKKQDSMAQKKRMSTNVNSAQFYYLDKIGKQQQPHGSSVCWAVCLANIHNGFYQNKNLGFCQILDKQGRACVKVNNNITVVRAYDNTRNSSILNAEANKIGLNLVKFNLNRFKNYKSIVKYLNQKKTPIIIQIQHATQTHLVYVSGYGTLNQCNYYYIFDPISHEEKYRNVKAFLSDYNNGKILKAWEVQKHTPGPASNLRMVEHPINIMIANTRNKIKEYYKEKTESDDTIHNPEFDNPLLFMNTIDLSLDFFIKQQTQEEEIRQIMKQFNICRPDIKFIPGLARPLKITRILNELYQKSPLSESLIGLRTYVTEQGLLNLDINSSENKIVYSIQLNDSLIESNHLFDRNELKKQLIRTIKNK